MAAEARFVVDARRSRRVGPRGTTLGRRRGGAAPVSPVGPGGAGVQARIPQRALSVRRRPPRRPSPPAARGPTGASVDGGETYYAPPRAPTAATPTPTPIPGRPALVRVTSRAAGGYRRVLRRARTEGRAAAAGETGARRGATWTRAFCKGDRAPEIRGGTLSLRNRGWLL